MFKLGLFGGGRNAEQQMVGGKPVYYDGQVVPQNAARTPAIQPGRRPNYSDDDSSSEYESEFTTRAIRHAFIKKVYFILFLQLGFTAVIIALFQCEPHCNLFAKTYVFVSFAFLIPSLVIYMILVCCQGPRRNYPLNLILLGIYTALSAMGYAIISAVYAADIVLYSFGITAAVCLLVTILAMQKCIDITGCGMFLCLFGLVLSLFGLVAMIMLWVTGWNETTRIMYLVYSSIGALLASLYFMFITQLILGGKKYELSPEEYVLGAIILYTEIMQLFMYILAIFGIARS